MNSKIAMVIFLCIAGRAFGGAATPAGTSGAVQSTPRQANPTTPPQPGSAQQNQAGGAPDTTQLNQLPPTVAATNSLGLHTQLGSNTNAAGVYTNQFGYLTNQLPSATNVTPTANSNNPPGNAFETSFSGFTNATELGMSDSAVTVADRGLLIQVRETVGPRLRAAGPWSPVNFVVRNAVVTIIGYVASPQVRQQIEIAVRSTPGVTGVVNGLRLVTQDQAVDPSDRALLVRIRAAVQPLLISIGAQPLHFIVRNGNIILVGMVSSAELRQRIETTVSQVPGVVAIVNRVSGGSLVTSSQSSVSATSSPSVTVVPPSPVINQNLVPLTNQFAATNQFGTAPVLPPTGRPSGLPPNTATPPGVPPAQTPPPVTPVPAVTTNVPPRPPPR